MTLTDVGKAVTAQALYERALASWPDRVAIVDGDRRTSYRQLDERSARLANAFLSLGASERAPAAVFLPNCGAIIEVDVACTRAGITRIAIGDRLSGDECTYVLGHADVAVLVTSRAMLAAVEAIPDCVRAILLVGESPRRLPSAGVRALGYDDALREASARLAVDPVDADQPSYLLYTSGTTGRPKAATHTHRSRAAATATMLAAELELRDRFVMAHVGPLSHGSGSKVIAVLASGGTNVVLPRFSPEGLASAIVDHGATHSFMVPTMIRRILEAGPETVATVRRMHQISFGGAPISPTLFERGIDTLGPVLTQVYGSSEAPHPVTLLRAADYESGRSDRLLASAGWAAAGVELRLSGVERGDDGEQVGELLIRGANVFQRYWNDPQATKDAFDEDGWYRSGDLAALDDTGLATFRDRKRDLIISGGLNVYPTEVERVLAEHPGVREVAVVGRPDEEWGEAVVAYVVPATGWTPSGADLIEWSRSRLASYKKPRDVEFLAELPLGKTNKVLKRELRDALWAGKARQVN